MQWCPAIYAPATVGLKNYIKKENALTKRDVSRLLFRSYATADDSFRCLGGSGQYSGFEFWHPAALVMLLVLKASGKISEEQIGKIKFELPFPLLAGCDGLAARLEEIVDRYGPYELSGTQDDLLSFWERFRAMKPDKPPYGTVNDGIRLAISNLA